jgi:hypothetical protein
MHIWLAILIGFLWGATNPFIRRGVLIAEYTKPKNHTGISFLNAIIHHLSTPAFAIPQLLNLSGGILFTATLSSAGADISIISPVANGVSLASNAVFDHLLGDTIDFKRVVPGLLLVFTGITLCTLPSSS